VLDLEERFLRENARHALPEKSMIVHQECPDRWLTRFYHASTTFSAGQSSTAKQLPVFSGS
jgi:hypothetical protein